MKTEQQYTLEQTSAPAAEPVSWAEVQTFGWGLSDDDQADTEAMIKAARGHCERVTGLQLVTATWRLYLDCLPDVIRVPRPPLQAVTEFAYADPTTGAMTAWAASNYEVDAVSRPGRIAPAHGKVWPTHRAQLNAVRVTFTAGFGAAAAVPAEIRQRILQAVKYRFDHRDVTDEEWLDRFFARNRHGWNW